MSLSCCAALLKHVALTAVAALQARTLQSGSLSSWESL